MIMFQRVMNLLKNVNASIRTYVLCLILSKGRKNCSDMARNTGINPKKLYAFLLNSSINSNEIKKALFDFANKTRDKDCIRTLVIDPTTIIKRYAKNIENLCYDRDGCTKHKEHCLVPVYAAIVDKNVKIPLNLNFWIQQKIIGKKKYKSKIWLAQELITSIKNEGVDFDFISLDGAFPTPDMFCFFSEKEIKFIMRIPKNRCITTKNGKRIQLKLYPDLKLQKNEREKTIVAELHGEMYYFTALKRKNDRNQTWETVYLVSNMNIAAKQQVQAYNLRWPIEKINRTTKQKFGSTHCQSLKAHKQQAHILACFLAHSVVELSLVDKQTQSVDAAVNSLRDSHFNHLLTLFANQKQIARKVKADSAPKPIQKHVKVLYNKPDSIRYLAV